MAMIFSVAAYYNFLSMRYNPQFLESKDASAYIEGTSMIASMLMIMFLIFFIVYSSNFFLNQRKKEIGYMPSWELTTIKLPLCLHRKDYY